MAAASKRKSSARAAFTALLKAFDVPLKGEQRQTPARAAEVWTDHLLAGQDADLSRLRRRTSPSRATTAVTLTQVGVHMVCPHHLTVSFGEAHLAYLPAGRLAGFGALADLAKECTARLILQEDATQLIADALVEHLDAVAAVAVIEATHPCHNILHPRSHRARAITWGAAGTRAGAARLRKQLREELDR